MGLTAEFVKNADPIIVEILASITSSILTTGRVPDPLKEGIITPFHKKDIPKSLPDSYRRITVTPLLGKLVEKELVCQMRE